MHKLARGALIIVFGVTIAWFGILIRPQANQADAKVFEKIFTYTKAMPDYLLEEKESSEPRKIKVNGNQTYLTVQTSKDEISDILNYYAGQYKPLPLFTDVVEAFSQIDNPSITEKISSVYNTLDCLKADQQFRFQGKTYGFWGAFEFHDQNLKIGSCEFNQLLAEAIKSGQLGRLGTFRVTMALKQGSGEKAKIINIWTDEEFNLHNLVPDSFGEMPGKDIASVQRFPGAVRKLSVEQENRNSLDSVVVYEADGTVLHHILFYHSYMRSAGWRANDFFEKTMKAKKRDNVMFYQRDGRECTLTIEKDSDSGKIITTVTDRTYKL